LAHRAKTGKSSFKISKVCIPSTRMASYLDFLRGSLCSTPSCHQGMFTHSRGFLIEFVSNCLFRASSAFKIFKTGLRSLELSFLGPQRLQDIQGKASVPRIVSFGPAAPSRYSRPDFGPSNCLFGPTAPSRYLRPDFGPSNCLFRASSASNIFEAELRILELFFGSAVPSHCSRSGVDPLICLFRPSNAFKEFELEAADLRVIFFGSFSRANNAPLSTCPTHGGNIPVRMPYVKYEGKSTVCNTDGPVFVSNALCQKFSIPTV
jgi:hypothetical protein